MSKRSDFEILRDLDQALEKLSDDTSIDDLINKAKIKEYEKMVSVKDKETRTQVGSWIDKKLWQNLKVQSAKEARSIGFILDDAVRLYFQVQEQKEQEEELNKHFGQGEGSHD